VTTPASTHGPAVGAADLTLEVCLGIAVAKPRSREHTKTAPSAPSQRDFGRQKRLTPAAQAPRTPPLGSPLHTIPVPTQLIRVPRG
jgi:hypothetical protein